MTSTLQPAESHKLFYVNCEESDNVISVSIGLLQFY